LHDIRSDAAFVRVGIAGQDSRQQSEECAAHADEKVGAHACGATFGFAFKTDEATEQARSEQAGDGAIDHDDLLQPAEVEGLREK
jgi:hypothetical protein